MLRRRKIRRELAEWSRHVGYEPARHHLLLIDALERVSRGELTRLMIFMPPGHAKSTYTSVLFPPFYLANNPENAIIGASNTGALAERFGRRCRNLILEHASILGIELSDDSQAAGQWTTKDGAEYYAAGVGAAITGRRANLALIDDPIASQADADSETVRNSTWDWYLADLRTRLKKNGAIVIIQTRWHEDDLSGRILPETYNGESGWIEARDGERWYVIATPALCENAETDPLQRQVGEPLWPSEYTLERLQQDEKTAGTRKWNALYQQRPKPLEGTLFKPDNIVAIDALPPGLKFARGWDFAATEQIGSSNPDWTAGARMARDSEGRFYICGMARDRLSPNGVDKLLKGTASQDGVTTEISIPQEPGAAGVIARDYFVKLLAGYRVHSSTESGDKVTRAGPLASQVEIGNVYMLRGPWNKALLDEMRAFPNGTKDDQVDALSRAFSRLIAPPRKAQRVRTNHSRR